MASWTQRVLAVTDERRDELFDRFCLAGAISPGTAKSLSALGIDASPLLERYQRAGVIRSAAGGAYLDAPALIESPPRSTWTWIVALSYGFCVAVFVAAWGPRILLGQAAFLITWLFMVRRHQKEKGEMVRATMNLVDVVRARTTLPASEGAVDPKVRTKVEKAIFRRRVSRLILVSILAPVLLFSGFILALLILHHR